MTSQPPKPRAGRPRRGTELERLDALLDAATEVFQRDGYGSASIDKVAGHAGVSTRTIYERFKNKADLLGAVIARLMDHDMTTVLSTAELDRLDLPAALTVIGETITGRACAPETAALYRICATESKRFPELAAKVRESAKARLDDAVAAYLRSQISRGTLALADPARAAVLFLQMVCAELNELLLFGSPEDFAKLDSPAHLRQVVEIFLYGAAPRGADAAPAAVSPNLKGPTP